MVFWTLVFLGTVRTEQPNVVFILIDDLGWSNVGFHNPATRTTPFLDKMTKSEHTVELTNVYSTHRTSLKMQFELIDIPETTKSALVRSCD